MATIRPPATLCRGLKLCRLGTRPSALPRPGSGFNVYVSEGIRVRSVLEEAYETAVEEEMVLTEVCDTARGKPDRGVGLDAPSRGV